MQGNEHTFNTLIKVASYCGDIEQVWESCLLHYAWSSGRAPKSCQKAEQHPRTWVMEQVLATLPLMEDCGVQPTPAVWGSILVACGKVSALPADTLQVLASSWTRLGSTGNIAGCFGQHSARKFCICACDVH